MRRERGSAILAVMVLLVIAALTLQMTSAEQRKRNQLMKAIAWANALQQVCSSADTYATRNWATVSTQPATPLTMADLAGVPPLTSDVLATLSGADVKASVIMSPAGCDATTDQCHSDVRVWTGALPGSDVDKYALANAIVSRVGDLASQSLPEAPAIFAARKNTRTDPNPSGIAGAVMVRCGEVNLASNDAGVRGNSQMTGALNAGGNNLTFKDLDAGVVQINLATGTGCTELNQVALDASGHYMYCDGTTWQSAAMPITQTETKNVYH